MAIGFLATKPFPFQKYFCTMPSNVLHRHGRMHSAPIMPFRRTGKTQTNEDGGPPSPVYLVPLMPPPMGPAPTHFVMESWPGKATESKIQNPGITPGTEFLKQIQETFMPIIQCPLISVSQLSTFLSRVTATTFSLISCPYVFPSSSPSCSLQPE